MRRPPLHPLLFAIFPLVSLYAHNADILRARSMLLPIAGAMMGAALLLAALRALMGDGQRAAAAASWGIMLFFLYPTLTRALSWILPSWGDHALPVWLGLTLLGTVVIGRTRRDLSPVTHALTAVAVVALGSPLAQMIITSRTPGPAAAAPITVTEPRGERPDIYYIILDAYGRQDVLAAYYGFDNSAFVQALEARGFYVAPQSRSNYAQTYLSLASSLNFSYLDDLTSAVGTDSSDRKPLIDRIAANRAASFLRGEGYAFVSFSTGYTGTELTGADVYIAAPLSSSELQQLLLDATPLAAMRRAVLGPDVPYAAHRHRILHTLDSIGRHTFDQPVFVFAHVLAPHPPFVLGTDGNPTADARAFTVGDGDHFTGTHEEYVSGYRRQVACVNHMVLQAIDRLLARSPAPIIIVQGDHGPGSHLRLRDVTQTDHFERMSILNAYFFPDRRYGRLYASITPVNTFRVVFEQYFGADLPLLADRSYASTWHRPYELVPVDPTAPAGRISMGAENAGAAGGSGPATRDARRGSDTPCASAPRTS